MSPRPLENVQSPMVPAAVGLMQIASGAASASMSGGGGGGGQQQQDGPRGGSISLTILFDFIIQRTYHELTVLADILPRKTDMERKVEIYNFSARTRQLFIRLLALVKWANSASKVDKSAHIMSFLDKQSMIFVDTADMLARMARETLVHIRLPNFHIHAAVEVLTTGNYARLPACIKEKNTPTEAITLSEKKSTLQRLNQVIQHRLVSNEVMPQMRKFKIDNGRVTFRVEHEFEVSLTLMGDGPNVPWRLIDIEILVDDKDTGCGKPLVHSQQVEYIHQVLQARMVDHPNALAEVYFFLHQFCQSLQLEVMFTQTLKLKVDRLEEDVQVEDYVPGEKLTVAYWRELTAKDPKSDLEYKLTVQTDPNDKARPLAVCHVPSLGIKETTEIAERVVRSDLISMERLLVHTVYVRSLARLTDVKVEFQKFLKDVDYHLQGTPAILTVPVLHPCLRAEQIHITVDTHTGTLRCHVPKHLNCPVMTELQSALNDDLSKLPAIVSELRHWITLRRCEKTLQHLPASPHDRLPLLHAVDHPIAKIGRHKLFVRFNRHPTVILVLEIKETAHNPCEMDFKFNLVYVKHAAIDDSPSEENTTESDIPKVYLRVQTLIEFDTFVATHGPGTYVDTETSVVGSKRKLESGATQPPAKQQKNPSYFIPELAHIVNMCDEKLPFVCLAQELANRNIPHSGLQIEANASALVLKLLTLPQPGCQHTTPENKIGTSAPVIGKRSWDSLMKRLLTVSIRTHPGVWASELFWSVEFVFHGAPLRSKHIREQGNRRAVTATLPGNNPADQISKTVDCLLDEWTKIVYLYSIVDEFVEQYKSEKLNLQNCISIKSYNYTSLVLDYGPNKEVSVKIYWCIETSKFNMVFSGSNAAVSAHSLMREQLQSHLNANYNLAQIVHMLHETYDPLSAVAKLAIMPHLGIPRPQIPVLSFCILPQSPTTLKIVYQAMYCLEICFRGGGLVSVRDGAHSRFAKRNVLDEFTPTQGLKGFLSKYVDETAVFRRRSQFEDDNPPSPIIEDPHGGPGSVGSSFLGNLRGPQSPRDGLRFAPPQTPPTISNPLTPASPHPIGQNHNFGMTSPPSMPHPSPSASLMPASPLNPQPSPMTAHSPGPNLAYMQNHPPDSSPFGVMSPAAAGSNWPGSPGMPRPSPRPGQSPEHKPQPQVPHTRVLPARSWAGATPTLLTDEALETLCRPTPHPQNDIPGPELCPLERFLGCGFMRRNLQRFIQAEDCLTGIQCDQPGVVLFKADGLQCQVFLNPNHMQSLHIKVTQIPPNMADGKPPIQWNLDDLHIIERFFDSRVVAPPYRPNALFGFGRMLNVPPQVLSDFIKIIRLELKPDLLPNLKWQVQFCMRSPPSAVPAVPTAVVMIRSKILFFLQITRIPYMGMDWKDSTSLVLPMVYDVTSNITQLAERREASMHHQSISTAAVSSMLRRFAEFSTHHGDCSIFPAVRDLLVNLSLPNEPTPPPQGQQQQQLQNQIISSPAAVASSPSPMMHSPMPQQQMNQQQVGAGMPQGYGGMGGGGGPGGPNPNGV